MSIEIKFKNWKDEVITQQQSQLINEYKKEYYDDFQLKKIEYYLKDVSLPRILYYLSDGENLSTVVSDLQNIHSGGTFYFNKQENGDYVIWDWEAYNGVQKIAKGKEVLDSQNREIARQELDIDTLVVIKTTKKYFLEDLGEFAEMKPVYENGTFEFDYNYPSLGPGEMSVEVNLSGFDVESYIINGSKNILLHPMIAAIFSWADHPYYHDATPLIPY